MIDPGRKLDDGLLADHWGAGRDEAGQPVALKTGSPIHGEWVKDHYGDGPLHAPWGVPTGAELDLGTGRITQSFTHGMAVLTTVNQSVIFRRMDGAGDLSDWSAGVDASGQPIPADAARPIYQAWQKDQQGEGPFGEPWGLPHSAERDHGDGRVTQIFTNGVATHFIHEPDASKQVVFN